MSSIHLLSILFVKRKKKIFLLEEKASILRNIYMDGVLSFELNRKEAGALFLPIQ